MSEAGTGQAGPIQRARGYLLERGKPHNRGPQFSSTCHLHVVTLVFLPKRRLQSFFLPGSLAVDVAAGFTQTANQEAAEALKA